MVNFSQQKNKIESLNINIDSQINTLERTQRIKFNKKTFYFNKRLLQIKIVDHKRVGASGPFGKIDPTAWDNYNVYILEEFPENFISFTTVVPVLSTDDGFSLEDDPTNFFDFSYYFTKITTNKFILNTFTNLVYTQLLPGPPSVIQTIPVYLDLYLYLINPLNLR